MAQAKKLIDDNFLVLYGGGLGGHDWLAAQLLYREAESLLQSEKNGPKK